MNQPPIDPKGGVARVRQVTIAWSLLEAFLTGKTIAADWYDAPADLRIVNTGRATDRPTCIELIVESGTFAPLPLFPLQLVRPELIGYGTPEAGLLWAQIPQWHPICVRGPALAPSPLAQFVVAAEKLASVFEAQAPGTIYRGPELSALVVARHNLDEWRRSRVQDKG